MTQWKSKRVGVLYGGLSHEREVSLRSGTAMAAALTRCGYHVTEIDVGKNLVDQLRATPIDVAVLALHGPYGEDGTVQGLLEFLEIPYTGTGVAGSAIAMDKLLCKRIARDLGIPLASDFVWFADDAHSQAIATNHTLTYPLIVKPAREGSTIGIEIVEAPGALQAALATAAKFDTKILVEEFVKGAEIALGVVCGETLPSVEIVPKSGFYDYASKYTKGMTDYIVPARIPDTTIRDLNRWTLQLWRDLDCRGFARADYIVRPDGSAVLLELNTIPGMTETSLVPKAAAHMGMSFETVCERVLHDACIRGKGW